MGLIVGLILLILLFPPFFAFGWKIHAAYDFARREEHRATPRPLGDFFWHELRRTTWKLGLAWVLLVLLLGLILQVRVIEGDKPLPVPYWFAFVQFLFPTAYMLAALVTQIAFALRMLPVMRARAMFAAGSAILAIALPLGLTIACEVLLPERLHRVSISYTNGGVVASLSTLYALAICVALPAWAIPWRRKMDAAWYPTAS